MTNQVINPKLSQLTSDDIETLIAKYYAKEERVDALIREYRIDCIPRQLSSLFPPIVVGDKLCLYCCIPMVQKRLSRSQKPIAHIYCPVCGHLYGTHLCNCGNCITTSRQRHELIHAAEAAAICEFALQCKPPVRYNGDASDLELRSAVALLALVRACLFYESDGSTSEEGSPPTLNCIDKTTIPFAPLRSLSNEYTADLIHRGLIAISGLSERDSFVFKRDKVDGYYPSRVRWDLTIEEPLTFVESIEHHARATPIEWPKAWQEAIKELWLEIAFAECKEFYRYCANERQLPPSGEASTDAMLKNILQEYSVAQCYRIIYAAAQKAADFLIRKRCHAKHAANYMIGECQRWADRARAENWRVSPFRRNFKLPRSAVSYVLFDVFLEIGDRGFTSVVSDKVVFALTTEQRG